MASDEEIDLTNAARDYLAKIGRKGGSRSVPKGTAALSPEERSERGREAAAARWGTKAAKKAAKKTAGKQAKGKK